MHKILVVCEETTPVRGIRLKILGRMSIFWRKQEGGSTIEYAEVKCVCVRLGIAKEFAPYTRVRTQVEDYLDEDITVWAPNPRKKEELWMFPGNHEYPFTFDLPEDLPDTLEDSR